MTDNKIKDHDNLKKIFEYFKTIVINPKNLNLYKEATTHPTCDKDKNYKRLAFYGDSVIQLVTTEFIYKNKTGATIKKMNNIRNTLVRNSLFTKIIKENMKWTEVLLIDPKIKNKLSTKSKVWANMFEAIVGAIIEDLGMEKAKVFIRETVLLNKDHSVETNNVTHNNELVKSKNKNFGFKLFKLHIKCIKYETIKTNNEYVVEILVNKKIVGRGCNSSRKIAKEMAAEQAYKYFCNK